MIHLLPRAILLLAATAILPQCASEQRAVTLDAARPATVDDERLEGWLEWRGPQQIGVSLETGLVDKVEVDGAGQLWSVDLGSRGTPVATGDRVYLIGFRGEDADLQEIITCLDAKTGRTIWEHAYSDFVSDVVYDRYAIGSPAIDPDTGNVFALTSPGRFISFDADGNVLWEHSLMEEFGRLTFPNGRTGAPAIDGEVVVVHVISSHWGPEAPARDRIYAFDKYTGKHLWTATPGEVPKDSSFSRPVFAWEGGRRVLYVSTGCGNVACIDARTGDSIWRKKLSIGGVNCSVLPYGDDIIAIHGKENVDLSTIGRMLSIPTGTVPAEGQKGPAVLTAEQENWRTDLVAFTSSPVLVGNRVYATVLTGELCCIDADTGKILWHEKLGPDQIHASPLAADGKLYVPMNNGSFWIVKPSDEGPEVLSQVQLEGNCLAAPAVWNGRLYVHTTKKLYCFGTGEAPGRTAAPEAPEAPAVGDPVRLQLVPADILLAVGEEIQYGAHVLDAHGNVVADFAPGELKLEAPPILSAKGDGAFTASRPGIGLVKATMDGRSATARVRTVPELEYHQDFEGFELAPHPKEDGVQFARPPSHWTGAGKKWEVRELDGEKVLARTLDTPLFQRAMGFLGHHSNSGYTMQMDILSDGNRRMMSSAGVVNQRYLIALKGNHKELEISSNDWRIKEKVRYRFRPKTWYTLKTRVDVAEDGSGVVRAKVWKRDEAEPEAWTLEVEHKDAHKNGAPGLWGFVPQSRFRVYVDNLSITPNE
ncbi:MAG: PQQ-binding-like beta-propeller repeat protein [bacterium]|nr:PQQ-binding-like beta-propeller repeat protein [bacterium]